MVTARRGLAALAAARVLYTPLHGSRLWDALLAVKGGSPPQAGTKSYR